MAKFSYQMSDSEAILAFKKGFAGVGVGNVAILIFKEWIVGQNADGLGEGFEQQDIETDEGILNVHFWDSADDYYVESEDDFYENHINNGMGGIS